MKFTCRIKKNKVFKYVLKKGIFSKGKYVAIHLTKLKPNKKINFFGVCVSKKNGNSVQRNKLKRWAREAYKIEEIKIKKGYNVVFIYKKNTKVDFINFSIIYNEFVECLKLLDMYDE